MEPYAVRPYGQRVVYFAPRTLTARLFDTEERARERYGNRCNDIYLNPQELRRVFERDRMIEIAIALDPTIAKAPLDPAMTESDAADILWHVLQGNGDHVKGLAQIAGVEPEDTYNVKLDRITSEEGREVWGRFPKQPRIIIEKLISLGKTRYEEIELKKIVHELVATRQLKTKQDPWRIFAYYAPLMGDHGFLYYPHKRHKLSDHKNNV